MATFMTFQNRPQFAFQRYKLKELLGSKDFLLVGQLAAEMKGVPGPFHTSDREKTHLAPMVGQVLALWKISLYTTEDDDSRLMRSYAKWLFALTVGREALCPGSRE